MRGRFGSRICIWRPRPSTRCSRVGVISNCAATWIMPRSRGSCLMCSPRSAAPRQTSNALAYPCELSNSPCLYLTAESDSAGFTSNPDGSNARTIRQRRQIRYGGLPVNSSVIMLSHKISHPPRRVGHAGQASESRRQLVLAVALGARSAWSMASGGGCVAGRARVDHGCVRARVVGKRKPSIAAAWRYGRCLERAARHHRRGRDDEPGQSKGARGAEGSGSSRRR